jgi:hypothetical protein
MLVFACRSLGSTEREPKRLPISLLSGWIGGACLA